MSRKHRRQQKSFPWPILMFGGIVLIAAAFLLANLGGKGNGGSAAASGAGSGEIAVDPAKIDYGYVKFGNNESFKIKVTNNGKGALRFAQEPYIEVLEGC